MGVKGLQYYIETHCPDACRNVSVEQLAHEYRIQHNCEPVLVVDGMALLYPLYSGSLEWVYGGQWLQFVKKLEGFIRRFNEIGVKLIFFFDGTVCSTKRNEWVKRRISKYKQISSIFYDIKANHCEPDVKYFQLPTSMGTLTRFALKELGAEVYQTDREADEVIAEFASMRQDVFAILSQDSDFIIYNTKPYLSLSHLDLSSLKTLLYDRNCLAFRYLHLYLNQLPLFACLVGNDIVSSDRLKHFHQRLIQKNGRTSVIDIVKNVVQLINTERWTGDINNRYELDKISIKVFGNTNLSWLFQDGLKSYAIGNFNSRRAVCINVHPDLEKAVYERHINCVNGPFIFNLLCNMEYESSEVMEDSSYLPSALTYREIRRRCYGVLFNCFLRSSCNQNCTKTGQKIVINEWCAYEGNFMERPETIEPLPLDSRLTNFNGYIPSIENLWFRCNDHEKLKLFWSILQVPMEFELLCKLPKHFVVLSCILNYLIGTHWKTPDIQPLEVAVFIGQALWKKDVADLQNLVVPKVDVRAVHLATLFMRGVSTALMVLGTCGNPFGINYAMPWHFFDGKLFHYLYVKAKERPKISKLCQEQEELMKEFYELLYIITNNTAYAVEKYDWKVILEDFQEPRNYFSID